MKTISELRSIALRSQASLLSDVIGAAALCVMLFGALHLPSLS